jgi:hypothetical protein
LDEASLKALKRGPKHAGTVNLTLEGIFIAGGAYGHMNAYRYEFLAQKIRNVAVVIKGMKDPAVEKKAEKKWACGGSNPK